MSLSHSLEYRNSLTKQSVFLIDLPKIQGPSSGGTHDSQFYKELVYFLTASTLHQNIIDRMSQFDFSETKRYAFVHSMYVPVSGAKYRKLTRTVVVRTPKRLGDELDTLV